MAHLIIKSATLQILKQNIALYDFLCDVIHIPDGDARAWLQGTRYNFMADALRYIHDTDTLTAVMASHIRVHMCRLLREIERNRKLRKHVNDVNQCWDAEGKNGAAVPGYSLSEIWRLSPTAGTQNLPDPAPITQLCNHLLHTYYYKNDDDVARALPLLMTSTGSPALVEQPPINEPSQDHVQTRPSTVVSTLTTGGDTDVFDLSAPIPALTDSVNRSRSSEMTTTHAPYTFLEFTSMATKRHQAESQMEGKRRRMAQWLNDQVKVKKSCSCHKNRTPMLDKTIALAKVHRAMTMVPRTASIPTEKLSGKQQRRKPGTILKLRKHKEIWSVKRCGEDDETRQC